jgi:DNA-binding PadR family transcriptional regulator
MQAEKLKGHLDLLLLSVLSRGPGHGYEIITRLKVHSDGAFELPEGTVYPALHRLETAGLLASRWDIVTGRRRRIYRLTQAGEAALADQAAQWRKFSGSMSRVLGTSAFRGLAATMTAVAGRTAPGARLAATGPAVGAGLAATGLAAGAGLAGTGLAAGPALTGGTL